MAEVIQQVNLLPREDGTRADLYALLARLFYAGPDQGLLFTIAQSDDFGSDEAGNAASALPMFAAWRALKTAAAMTHAQDAIDEYNEVFISVGRAPISIFASHYLTENYKELTLVHLRDEVLALGLGRNDTAQEPEDHLSALLDVMRHLVLRGASVGHLEAQQRFLNSYLAGWFENFCDLVVALPATTFYKPVAELMRVFLRVELESLAMS